MTDDTFALPPRPKPCAHIGKFDDESIEVFDGHQLEAYAREAVRLVLAARRAPAPISDEFTVEDADLNDLLNWTASLLSPQTNMDAGIGWMQALEKVQARLAQSATTKS